MLPLSAHSHSEHSCDILFFILSHAQDTLLVLAPVIHDSGAMTQVPLLVELQLSTVLRRPGDCVWQVGVQRFCIPCDVQSRVFHDDDVLRI